MIKSNRTVECPSSPPFSFIVFNLLSVISNESWEQNVLSRLVLARIEPTSITTSEVVLAGLSQHNNNVNQLSEQYVLALPFNIHSTPEIIFDHCRSY